jgi:hypothetical protein
VLVYLASLVLFCFAAYQFTRNLTSDKLLIRVDDGRYSRAALRVGRKYKLFAWSVLMLVMFYSMAVSFYSVVVEL